MKGNEPQGLRSIVSNEKGIMSLWFLIAVLWGVLYWLTPFQLDDLRFIGVYRSYNGLTDNPSLEAWWNYICDLREGDSARVSNLLVIPFALWEPWKWISPWLTGILTATLIWMAGRYAFGKNLNWSSFALIWLLIVLFLPWRNFILTVTYSLNYVYPAVLTMFLIWLIMGARRWNARFWFSLFLVVIAGWWHEGFAATALCGMGLVMLLRRGKMPAQWWILCIVYGITVILLVSSSWVRQRISIESGSHGKWMTPGFVYDSLTTVVLVLSVVGASCLRAGRNHLANLFRGWKFPVFLTVSIVGTLLAVIFIYTPRVCFWPSLAAIIALGLLWAPVWNKLSSGLKGVIGLLCITLCVIHLILTISWQTRYYHEYNEIRSEIESSPTGTIFHDIIPTSSLPRYTLFFPSKEMWVTQFHLQSLSSIYGYPPIAVVPASLREATPSNSRRLKGNIPVYTTGDALFIDAGKVPGLQLSPDSVRYIRYILDSRLTLDDGSVIDNPTAFYQYYVNAPGDTLIYLYPFVVPTHRVRAVNLSTERMHANTYPNPNLRSLR